MNVYCVTLYACLLVNYPQIKHSGAIFITHNLSIIYVFEY